MEGSVLVQPDREVSVAEQVLDGLDFLGVDGVARVVVVRVAAPLEQLDHSAEQPAAGGTALAKQPVRVACPRNKVRRRDDDAQVSDASEKSVHRDN